MLKRIKNWFTPHKKIAAEEEATMTINFLRMLDITKEEELSCGEVHALVDEYVELKMRGEDVEALMPLMKHHLDMCKECFDEYEALLAALAFEESL